MDWVSRSIAYPSFLPTLGSIPHHKRLHAYATEHLNLHIQNSSNNPTVTLWSLFNSRAANTGSIVFCFRGDVHEEESFPGLRNEFGVIWQENLGSQFPSVWPRSRVEGNKVVGRHFPLALCEGHG